jgi:hypothetical protein
MPAQATGRDDIAISVPFTDAEKPGIEARVLRLGKRTIIAVSPSGAISEATFREHMSKIFSDTAAWRPRFRIEGDPEILTLMARFEVATSFAKSEPPRGSWQLDPVAINYVDNAEESDVGLPEEKLAQTGLISSLPKLPDGRSFCGGVPRSHPGIRDELACRSFVTKTIQRLGLNFEAVKPSVGRPPNRA